MRRPLTVLIVLMLPVAAAGAAPPRAPAAAPGPAASVGLPAAGETRFVIDPAASTASYRVGESLLTQNQSRTAVGATSAIRGAIYIDRAHPARSRIGTITVDISTLRSDSARRDDALRTRWLESAKYPIAVFVPTSVRGLPDTLIDGRELPVRIAGDLEIHGVVRPAVFAGTVTLAGSVLTGIAATTIRMTDYGVEPPSLLGFFRVDDQAEVDLQFTAEEIP